MTSHEPHGVPNHRQPDCLPRRRSKKRSKLGVTGLCEGNSPVTGGFPLQRDSNAENVSIWWCHHEIDYLFNSLFKRATKDISENKTSKLRVTDLCAENSPGPVNSPHKRPVTRKMFPFDDVIMSGFIWDVITHQIPYPRTRFCSLSDNKRTTW